MGDQEKTVECCEHGKQQQTYVCTHIVDSLGTGEKVGFVSYAELDNSRPDAWCESCNNAFEKYGEWNEVNEQHTEIRILCGVCYDAAKVQNACPKTSLNGSLRKLWARSKSR